jgi:hypothetical protein
MNSKTRLAVSGAKLLLLAFIAIVLAINVVHAENAPQTTTARPVRFHWRRGPLSASFLLANDARIQIGKNSNARLADLRRGQIAHVAYTIENGRWLAHEIVVNPPHGAHAAYKAAGAGSDLHAHGAILGYDSSTGRLTIRFHH